MPRGTILTDTHTQTLQSKLQQSFLKVVKEVVKVMCHVAKFLKNFHEVALVSGKLSYYKFFNSLKVAVGNCSLHSAPRQHSASQHSPRQTSDAGFEAHILKAGRRLHTLDVVSQPSRTFESPRARRDAPNKRRSLRRSFIA